MHEEDYEDDVVSQENPKSEGEHNASRRGSMSTDGSISISYRYDEEHAADLDLTGARTAEGRHAMNSEDPENDENQDGATGNELVRFAPGADEDEDSSAATTETAENMEHSKSKFHFGVSLRNPLPKSTIVKAVLLKNPN